MSREPPPNRINVMGDKDSVAANVVVGVPREVAVVVVVRHIGEFGVRDVAAPVGAILVNGDAPAVDDVYAVVALVA